MVFLCCSVNANTDVQNENKQAAIHGFTLSNNQNKFSEIAIDIRDFLYDYDINHDRLFMTKSTKMEVLFFH